MTLSAKALLASLALLLSATGCGDPLADSRYEGEPRFELGGPISSLDAGLPAGPNYLALVWDDWARQGDLTTSQPTSLGTDALPFEYAIQVLDLPPAEAHNALTEESFGTVRFATGYIVVFQDGDGDGALTGDGDADAVRGIAPKHVVFYAEEMTPTLRTALTEWGRIRNVDALRDGYNLMRGICTGAESVFDDLEVIEPEPVPIITAREAPGEGDTARCLDFH